MTRNVIGDFREWRWFYFFLHEFGLSVGIGGKVFMPTLFVAATDGPRNDPSPFGYSCTMEGPSNNLSRDWTRAAPLQAAATSFC